MLKQLSLHFIDSKKIGTVVLPEDLQVTYLQHILVMNS